MQAIQTVREGSRLVEIRNGKRHPPGKDVPESVQAEMTFHVASQMDQVMIHVWHPECQHPAGGIT
jgi:hypothetical protein